MTLALMLLFACVVIVASIRLTLPPRPDKTDRRIGLGTGDSPKLGLPPGVDFPRPDEDVSELGP